MDLNHKKLEAVEQQIEDFEKRKSILIKKKRREGLSSDEEVDLEDCINKLAELKKKEIKWMDIIKSNSQGGKKWTFKTLVQEKVPDLNKYETTTSNRTGTVSTYPRECGRSFKDWDTFYQELAAFYHEEKIVKAMESELQNVEFAFNKKPCGSEKEVEHRTLTNFGSPLEILLQALGIPSLFKDPQGDNQVLFNPDIVWKIGPELNNNLGLVIEVKTWWDFDAIDHIVDQYHEDVDKKKDQDTKIVKALQQIYGYMSYNYMRYGILTTYKHTYFLRRMGKSTLAISKPIPLDGIHDYSILQCWLFVLCKSHQEGFYSSPAGHPSQPTFKTETITFTNDIYETVKYNLVHINSSQIHFADLIERKYGVMSRGACGAVISGSIYGYDNIKLKTVDSFNIPKALEICQKETAIYHKLENLQGRIIPRFFGFFNLHGILILALEDCGTPLKDTEFDAYQEKVDAAIKEINSYGVKHADLESRSQVYPNILLKGNCIRIIDFHISEEIHGVDEMESVNKKRKLRK
ncbi:hypothetical protein HK103_003791 [Boothiomyces macroporosus]|uniref:Protein kinase domain-containing protein n=1 Tax=Boothiomyces macroporosus TaxID=261099 RepID=A0AAD5U8T0_9FUNG|nr:hypothetical protein HK103_003791 [Boothiomyces macroporosus]